MQWVYAFNEITSLIVSYKLIKYFIIKQMVIQKRLDKVYIHNISVNTSKGIKFTALVLFYYRIYLPQNRFV